MKDRSGALLSRFSIRRAAFGAATAIFLCGAGAAHATVVTYNGFGDISGLTLKGSATTTTTGDGTVLRLTSTGSQSGAAYSTSPFTLGTNATFSTQFQFRFTEPGGVDPADGITFVLAASPTGLGNAGYGMGYENVANSIAIEFDTYNNSFAGGGFAPFAAEPDSSNHVALDLNGSLTNTAAVSPYGNASCGFTGGAAHPVQNDYAVPGCMANGDLWTVNISYDGTKLNVSLQDSLKGSAFAAISDYAIDVGSYLGTNTAFVGFTGSSGAGWENQDILNWRLANTAQLPPVVTGVPEPASLALLGTGLLGLALTRRRRS
jgi:hypothetical protein